MWKSLRAAAETTGVYPMILADKALLAEAARQERPARTIVADAARINAPKWLRARAKLNNVDLERGSWPRMVKTPDSITAPYDFEPRVKPRMDVQIALLPTGVPWEAAAHLGFSAVNYDIAPEHHVAVHRLWFEQFGAEPIAATGETIEFLVGHPPSTRSAAMTLARTFYGYCPDLVEQGTQTIEYLAALLLHGRFWYFWWD